MEVLMDVSSFINDIKQWGNENDDIKSIILVGSYARGEEREDSDVDLVVIASNPDVYINNNFIDNFGKVEEYKKEDWGRVTSIRVWYSNSGLEVEFGITTPIWVEKPLDNGTFRVLSDGYKVILDKEDYFKDII
jgi:predicted nucleotidyltransferase